MSRDRAAIAAMVAGGLLMAVLFVPFTLTHGPTSYNIGEEILGADMHGWGFLLGVVPCLLLGLGLWQLRDRAAGGRSVTRSAWTVVAVGLLVSAFQDLLFLSLGPPFLSFVVVPALLVAVATHRSRHPRDTTVRIAAGVLALVLLAGLVNSLFLREVEDGLGNYRTAAFLLYGAGGVAWAALGVAVGAASMVSRSRTA